MQITYVCRGACPRWQVTFSQGMQIQTAGGSVQVHLPPCLVGVHFGCPCFGGSIRQSQGGDSALCYLLTTGQPRAELHSTFHLHVRTPALSGKQKQMPQGRLATIKQCIMKPEDTAGELDFKAKVPVIKVLSLNS